MTFHRKTILSFQFGPNDVSNALKKQGVCKNFETPVKGFVKRLLERLKGVCKAFEKSFQRVCKAFAWALRRVCKEFEIVCLGFKVNQSY